MRLPYPAEDAGGYLTASVPAACSKQSYHPGFDLFRTQLEGYHFCTHSTVSCKLRICRHYWAEHSLQSTRRHRVTLNAFHHFNHLQRQARLSGFSPARLPPISSQQRHLRLQTSCYRRCEARLISSYWPSQRVDATAHAHGDKEHNLHIRHLQASVQERRQAKVSRVPKWLKR